MEDPWKTQFQSERDAFKAIQRGEDLQRETAC